MEKFGNGFRGGYSDDEEEEEHEHGEGCNHEHEGHEHKKPNADLNDLDAEVE
jgi:hypothetical protein